VTTPVDVTLAVKAEEEGLKRLLHLGDIIDLPISGIAVTSAKLATHREQIKKVIQATLRGTRFIKQKRPETIRIIQSHLRITLSQATKAYDSAIRSFTDDGFVSERAVSLDVRRAKEEIQLAKDPSLRAEFVIVDNYTEEIQAAGGTQVQGGQNLLMRTIKIMTTQIAQGDLVQGASALPPAAMPVLHELYPRKDLLLNPQDFDDLALRAELRNEGIAVALKVFPEGLCRSS